MPRLVVMGELTLAELTMEMDIDNDVVFGTAPGSDTGHHAPRPPEYPAPGA